MVGVGTALGDDPLLTVRLPGLEQAQPAARGARHASAASAAFAPRRDGGRAARAGDCGRGRLGSSAHGARRTWRAGRNRAAGARAATSIFASALSILAQRGVTRVFSEGGPLVAAALIGAELVDDVFVMRGEKPFGRDGPSGARRGVARAPGRSNALPRRRSCAGRRRPDVATTRGSSDVHGPRQRCRHDRFRRGARRAAAHPHRLQLRSADDPARRLDRLFGAVPDGGRNRRREWPDLLRHRRRGGNAGAHDGRRLAARTTHQSRALAEDRRRARRPHRHRPCRRRRRPSSSAAISTAWRISTSRRPHGDRAFHRRKGLRLPRRHLADGEQRVRQTSSRSC